MTRLKRSFPVSKIRLALIALLTLCIFFFPAWLFGTMALKITPSQVAIIICLPVITGLLHFIYKRILIRGKQNFFTGCKYTKFPLLMFFDPEPVKYYKYKPQPNWNEKLEEGDLLLRRHDRYLDGLILRQVGYYTHAGIVTKEKDDSIWVYHAVGTGLTKTKIKDFAHCDDIMVLRITKQKIQNFLDKKPATSIHFLGQQNRRSNLKTNNYKTTLPVMPRADYPKPVREPVEENDVRKMIEESGKRLHIDPVLLERELRIYDQLVSYSLVMLHKNWQSVITGMAKAYYEKKILYDFSFDFLNPDRMSCIEFAWNCYKCFLPMHKIRRKNFTFFASLRARILVPDQFIKSSSFECVYSFKHFDTKKEIVAFCKKSVFKFWTFVGVCVLCQLVLLGLISLILKK